MSKQRSASFPWTTVVIILVAVVAILLAVVPNPKLEWDEFIVPSAASYAENVLEIPVQDRLKPFEGIQIVVTGATSGIGLGITRKLSLLGATVIAIGRSPTKLHQLMEEIPSVHTVLADFSDLDSVHNATNYIRETYDRVDFLVNNAGIHTGMRGIFNPPQSSKQGYDLAFTVNYLSHFLLTERLMPLLQKSRHPKVVQVSSTFHIAVDGSDLATDGGKKNPIASEVGGSHGFYLFRSQRQYGNSKLAQILYARSLQSRYGITAFSSCPTWVGTQIVGESGSLAHSFMESVAFDPDGFGLSSVLHAIVSPPSSGDFFRNAFGAGDLPPPQDMLPSWTYQKLPLRDMLVASAAYTLVFFLQRFFPARETGRSSIQSYNQSLQDELYDWSKQAVSNWL